MAGIGKTLTNEQFALLLVVPLLIFSLAIVVYPITYSFWFSLNDINFFERKFVFIGLEQYVRFLGDENALHYIGVTLRFTAEVVVISMLLGLAMALVLNEPFRGRRFVRVVLILPWAVSEFATAVIWRYMYNPDLGLLYGITSTFGISRAPTILLTPEYVVEFVSLSYSWHFTPLIAFFLLSGLQTVSEELYKSAKIDGAGPLRRLIYVTLPHMKYAVLISLVLVTLEAARATDIILILSSGGPGIASETLTYHIFRQTFQNLNLGIGSAISYILLAMIIVVALVYFLLLTKRGR